MSGVLSPRTASSAAGSAIVTLPGGVSTPAASSLMLLSAPLQTAASTLPAAISAGQPAAVAERPFSPAPGQQSSNQAELAATPQPFGSCRLVHPVIATDTTQPLPQAVADLSGMPSVEKGQTLASAAQPADLTASATSSSLPSTTTSQGPTATAAATPGPGQLPDSSGQPSRPGSLQRPPPISAVATALTQQWLGTPTQPGSAATTAARPGLTSLISPQSQGGMHQFLPSSSTATGQLVRIHHPSSCILTGNIWQLLAEQGQKLLCRP